jgi:hypothetical protein
MAPSFPIPDGHELPVGLGRGNAIKAIALAEDRGYDSSAVRRSMALNGYLVPVGDSTVTEPEDAEVEEVVIPDPQKANHDAIDNFAETHGVTYDGIEAENAEKPTKAEKVAHITKTLEAAAAENDAHAEATGELVQNPDLTNQSDDSTAAAADPKGE